MVNRFIEKFREHKFTYTEYSQHRSDATLSIIRYALEHADLGKAVCIITKATRHVLIDNIHSVSNRAKRVNGVTGIDIYSRRTLNESIPRGLSYDIILIDGYSKEQIEQEFFHISYADEIHCVKFNIPPAETGFNKSFKVSFLEER